MKTIRVMIPGELRKDDPDPNSYIQRKAGKKPEKIITIRNATDEEIEFQIENAKVFKYAYCITERVNE